MERNEVCTRKHTQAGSMMFSRRSKAHLLASQEYDEESGDIKGSVRVGKCPPTRVLRWWFGAIAMLVLFLAGLRWLERWQQIRNRVADAQASGALLQGSAYVDRLVPDDSLPILIPLANRPEYFSQVVEALNSAAGLEDALVVFSQDGNDAEIHDLAMRQLKRPKHKIHLWHRRPWFGIPSLKDNEYATTDNVYSLLSFAFDVLKAPGAIILESDVVPSHDFYEFFQWVHQHVLRDPKYRDKVFTINGFNMESAAENDLYELKADRFTVWGWSMSERVWPIVKQHFASFHNWDHQMQRIREQFDLVSLTPSVGRARHVGIKGVNFEINEQDPLVAKWLHMHVPKNRTHFADIKPKIESLDLNSKEE